MSEEVGPLVGERKRSNSFPELPLLSGGTCHPAAPVWLVLWSHWRRFGGSSWSSIPRRFPLCSDVCASGSFSDILGDCLGALGCFPLFSGRRKLWSPGTVSPESSWRILTSLLTFSFSSSLQRLDSLPENKWCQVKLVNSKGKESPEIIWCAFFFQEMFLSGLSVCVPVACCSEAREELPVC